MPVNLAYRSYQFLWGALDWLYPPVCGGCGHSGVRWCEACSKSTSEIDFPICPICGNQNSTSQPCLRCREAPPFYTSLRSYTVFKGPIREAVHRLKYQRDISLGEALARPMITCLKKLNWSLDVITSVPLGLVRFHERGYNQATLLARPIALSFGLPFSTKILARVRETKTQVGLSATERQSNMAGAFHAERKWVQSKSVLVVDDVATSGATLNACAQALLVGGASRVYGFSLARAIFSLGMDDNVV